MQFRRHPVELSLPEDPTIKVLVEDYYTQVSHQFLTSGQYRLTELNYATSDACAVCHRSQFEAWQKSKHAHAYETLVQKNRHHVPECLTCHSEQFRRTQPPPPPGSATASRATLRATGRGKGAMGKRRQTGEVRAFHPAKQTTGQQTSHQSSVTSFPLRREHANTLSFGVECATCHGDGLLHSLRPSKGAIVKTPKETLCRSCHTAVTDPRFAFQRAWAKIRH